MIADAARPRLADGVAAGQHDAGRITLSRMQRILTIAEPTVVSVLGCVDGSTPVATLLDVCDGVVGAMATAYHWLNQLTAEGWLTLTPQRRAASEVLEWPSTEAARCLLTWDLLDTRVPHAIDAGAEPERVIACDGDLLWVSPRLHCADLTSRAPCWTCTVSALRRARPTTAAASATWNAAQILLPAIPDDVVTQLLSLRPARHDDDVWEILRCDDRGAVHGVHRVRRREHCERCGGIAAGRRLAPMTPDDVLDPLTGVVHDYRELTNTPPAVALGWCLPDLPGRATAFPIMASGRGATPAIARAAVAYEAVERCSAYQRPSDRFRVAPFDAVRDIAIAPNAIMQYSAAQLSVPQRGVVPEPLPDGQPIAWTEVQSLTTGTTRLVPTGLCYLSAAPNDDGRFIWGDSNGCAAGTSLDDATARALFELIERDASAMWWYTRGACAAVPPALCGDAWHDAAARWAALGRDAWTLDLTTDVGIPTVAAVSCNARDRGAGIAIGFGVALSIPDAVTKALGELAQTIEAMEHLLRGVVVPRAAVEQWWMQETIDRHAWMRPVRDARAVLRPPVDPGPDLTAWLCRHLASLHYDCLRLDLTRPDVGVPVVRMFVPGLRSIRRRLGGTRWHDVPLKLGRLSQPMDEADANPIELPY